VQLALQLRFCGWRAATVKRRADHVQQLLGAAVHLLEHDVIVVTTDGRVPARENLLSLARREPRRTKRALKLTL
jgi:hypothetical protein